MSLSARKRIATPRLTATSALADPQGGVANRQGRPQIRRVSRPRHAAAGRTLMPPSSPSATRCSRCALPTSATRRCCVPPSRTPRRTSWSFVPSLGTREVLAFGEGVALPTRLRFKEVPVHQLPRGEASISTVPSATSGHDMHFVGAVLERWRGATSNRDVPNDPTFNDRRRAARGGSANAATVVWGSIQTASRF